MLQYFLIIIIKIIKFSIKTKNLLNFLFKKKNFI